MKLRQLEWQGVRLLKTETHFYGYGTETLSVFAKIIMRTKFAEGEALFKVDGERGAQSSF